MSASRRTLTLALAQTPGIGGKTVTRVLARNDLLGRSIDEFLSLGAETLVEDYKFSQKSAALWHTGYRKRLKEAEEERARLDAFGVILVTPADAHYPRTLEEFGVDSPGLLYLYGNLKLISSPTVAVVASRNAPFDALEMIGRSVEKHVLDGKVLVSSHDTGSYQRAAVVPLRWGAPRIMVLDSGLFAALGPELKDEPFAAARLWRFQFDPLTDLAVSAVSPKAEYHRNSNRLRDGLVFGLSREVDLAWCTPGGNMERLGLVALKSGRPVRVNPVSPAADSLLAAGASTLEVASVGGQPMLG